MTLQQNPTVWWKRGREQWREKGVCAFKTLPHSLPQATKKLHVLVRRSTPQAKLPLTYFQHLDDYLAILCDVNALKNFAVLAAA